VRTCERAATRHGARLIVEVFHVDAPAVDIAPRWVHTMHAMADDDAEYFDAYADMSVHKAMLADRPRNEAYKEALALAVAGKVVLDVGAGTGLLSLFAASSGASRVYAVEASPLAELLPAVFTANGFDEDRVVVVRGRIEDVTLPEKVDVLVSEWMGFHLLHESMLDSVLHARDAFLKPDGIMLPSHATVYAAPVNMDAWAADRFDFWQSVESFDMSAFVPSVAQQALTEPQVTCIQPGQLLAEPQVVAELDLATVSAGELSEIGTRRRYSASRDGIVHGFGLWFTCMFKPTDVELSTAPSARETHWKQTVVLLPEVRARVTVLCVPLCARLRHSSFLSDASCHGGGDQLGLHHHVEQGRHRAATVCHRH
jgi:2-polyprenyl-3-methyl-5-hydroxy-6-metoxy-1,4-benzoquinol methylase